MYDAEKDDQEIRYIEECADRYYSYISSDFPFTNRYW